MKTRTNCLMILATVTLAALTAWQLSPSDGVARAQTRHEDHADADCHEKHEGKNTDADGHDESAEEDGHARDKDEADPHAGHDHEGEADGHDEPDDHDKDEADPHAGHDHEADGHDEPDDHDKDEADPHAGHDHSAHADEGESEVDTSIRLTAAQRKKLGITLSTAAAGTLSQSVQAPGEIVINADRMAHITPRAAGVVRKVHKKVGDRVKAGEVMAVLDSVELGTAKIAYVTLLNELNCRSIDLTRAQAIRQSTVKLLAMLDESPTLDQLRTADFADAGEDHSKLVSGYAELAFAKAAYDREKKLLAQDISSKGDFQAAESAYKKAYAEYVAARSSAAFDTRRDLLEARQSLSTNELSLKAAQRTLALLGVTDHALADLRAAVVGAAPATTHECTGPDCEDCKAAKPESPPAPGEHHCDVLGEQLGFYDLRAPFDGVVIDKHIVRGEKLGDEAEAYTVADLSNVWVDLSIYQKDLPSVRAGQAVRIAAGRSVRPADGVLAFVSPLIDPATRTCLARVVLANTDGSYRPGLFVSATVALASSKSTVLVPRSAVQQIESATVVFIPDGDALKPWPVTAGRSSRTHVEVVSGLKPGAKYVSTGAFQLKAEIVTSGLGAHAGHGH